MKTLLYIARKDLLQVVRDRTSFIFLLVLPLAFIAVYGFAFGNAFGGSTQININVALDNQDTGYVGKAITSSLKSQGQLNITIHNYSTVDDVKQHVKNGDDDAGFVIPAGASDTLTAASSHNQPVQDLIQFYSLPNSSQGPTTIAQQLVTGTVDQLVSGQFAGSAAVGQVNQVCSLPGNHCDPSTIDATKIAQTVGNANNVNANATAVQTVPTGSAPKVNNFDQFVPGIAIFFALFSINAVAGTILQEKEDGTFRRLLIAPVQKYALLGGKLLAQFILIVAQLALLFIIGFLAFHIDVGSWPGLILIVCGAAFAATGLGMLLVSLVKTRRQLNPIVTLVVLLTSAIGGAWWPLFLEPSWLQQIAKIGITAWAMEGLNGLMIYGKDFMSVLPDILGLLAYGLITLFIAMRLFRFQVKSAA